MQIFEDYNFKIIFDINFEENYFVLIFIVRRFELIQLIYQFSKRKDITPFSLLRFMRS